MPSTPTIASDTFRHATIGADAPGFPMNPALIVRHGRNLVSAMEINANRLIGREMVPMRTDTLAIEPTSACNLKCRFCAYEKKESPKLSMKNDRFADYIGQA